MRKFTSIGVGGTGAVTAGVAKGIGGAIVKPFAGLSGFFGYAMKGERRELQKTEPKSVDGILRNARMDQGVRQQNEMKGWEKDNILTNWKGILEEKDTRVKQKIGRKGNAMEEREKKLVEPTREKRVREDDHLDRAGWYVLVNTCLMVALRDGSKALKSTIFVKTSAELHYPAKSRRPLLL